MSNVINIAKVTSDASPQSRLSLLDQLHNAGTFYDVKVTDNLFPDGLTGEMVSTGKKTVVNSSNGKALSVMSSGYVVVQNSDIFQQFDKVLANSDLDLTGAYTKIQIDNHGAKVLVDYVFPSHSITTASGDETALSITCTNSFDGSGSFHVHVGFFRFKCANSMVLGTHLTHYNKRHCKGLSIEAASQVVGTGLRVWLDNQDKLEELTRTPVNSQDVYRSLAKLPGFKDFQLAPDYTTYLTTVAATKNRIDNLQKYMKVWSNYEAEMGMTEWALLNTMTHISSHGVGNKEPSISYKISKQAKVSEIANSLNIGLDYVVA